MTRRGAEALCCSRLSGGGAQILGSADSDSLLDAWLAEEAVPQAGAVTDTRATRVIVDRRYRGRAPTRIRVEGWRVRKIRGILLKRIDLSDSDQRTGGGVASYSELEVPASGIEAPDVFGNSYGNPRLAELKDSRTVKSDDGY
jgi:hypothetical protein